MLIIGIIVLLALGGGYVFWQKQSPSTPSTYIAGDIWMEMQPVQCLQNPWEVEWTTTHPGVTYPRGELNIIEPAEKEIITAYYATQGIPIMEVSSLPPQEGAAVCLACTCAQGYTLKLRIPSTQSDAMTTRGFSLSQ